MVKDGIKWIEKRNGAEKIVLNPISTCLFTIFLLFLLSNDVHTLLERSTPAWSVVLIITTAKGRMQAVL